MSACAEGVTDHILVAGIGNDFRSDDGAGVAVARQLDADSLQGVRAIELKDDLIPLLEAMEGKSRAFIIDAARSGAPPGTIHRITDFNGHLSPELFSQSTHSMSLSDVVELARVNGMTLPDIVLYGIEGSVFDHGQSLSPEVTRAVSRVFKQIRQEIIHESESREA
jgi:hydrogenase maturation protease